MADIIHCSEKESNWDSYWSYHSIEKDLKLCKSDGLMPIFDHFLSKDRLILEAGCGLGKWVVYFQKQGFKIVGLDGNLGCLSQIKKYAKDVKLVTGDVESLPIKSGSLDIYISLGVIEHFKDGPIQALREARRVLKPDGLVFIEIPYLNWIRKITLPFKNIYRYARKRLNKEPRDYYFAHYIYTENELKKFLRMAGFEIIFVTTKDDILPYRSIGLWLDFPILRDKTKDDCEHALNLFGIIVSGILNSISPWISSACVVCIGKLANSKLQDSVGIPIAEVNFE